MGPVTRIHSLYNYCFYVSTDQKSVLWQWRPYLHEDENGLAVRDENGDYIEDISRMETTVLMIDDQSGQTK